MNLFFSSYKEFKKIVFLIFLWLFLNIILNHQGFDVKKYFINPFTVVFIFVLLLFIFNSFYGILLKYEENIKKNQYKILIIFFLYLFSSQLIFNYFLENANPDYSGDFGIIRIAATEIYYRGGFLQLMIIFICIHIKEYCQ